MNETFKTFGIIAIVLLTLYLLLTFYAVTFNIAHWHEGARVTFVVIGGAAAFCIGTGRHFRP